MVSVMDGWDWVWGALMMVLFWGGLIAIVVFAVTTALSARSRRDVSEPTDPQAILEERFARGEISEEEFEERKRLLRSRAA